MNEKVPTITRNSPTKWLRPGRPTLASATTRNAPARRGVTVANPPISRTSRVRVRSATICTRRNSAAVVSPWFTISSTLPDSAVCVNTNVPSTAKPRCEIDEYATSRFTSVWIRATTAP